MGNSYCILRLVSPKHYILVNPVGNSERDGVGSSYCWLGCVTLASSDGCGVKNPFWSLPFGVVELRGWVLCLGVFAGYLRFSLM